ncbi:MAG: carbohydrate kinase family protein [Planctomycetia bacterium]|nr:carbohydrate kinase family protein [Planctomycetia bacterium]
MAVDCLSVGILVADHLCSPIPRVPRVGELILADSLPLRPGGCAVNAAIDLAKVGVQVGVVGCVGVDAFGNYLIDVMNKSGVETSGVRRDPTVETSGSLIINVDGEDRRYIHSIGASASVRPEDIPLERVRSAKVLYVGGYLLMKGLLDGALTPVFRAARAAGVITALDVVLPGPGDHWPQLEGLLAETDLFLPNTDEAAVITGLNDPVAQADRFRAAGAKTVVITCGEHGTVLVNDQVRLRANIFRMNYVGGAGSGDAFDAGYIAALLAGGDERTCLAWGSALGASCVRAVGTTEGVFNKAEVEAFLADNRLEIKEL